MRDPRFAKFVVFVNSLVPLAMLCWYEYNGHAGANPPEYALHTTGMLALIFLLLSLCITPLRKTSGWNWLSHFRRMLGLFAFFYACLHFAIYFVYYQSWSLMGVIYDTKAHRYILFGMACLTLLLPLALTSTTAAIKKMGAKRWKELHRLVYYAAIAGVVHYYMLVKADETKPVAFAIVLAILLGYRLVKWLMPARKNIPVPVIPIPAEP